MKFTSTILSSLVVAIVVITSAFADDNEMCYTGFENPMQEYVPYYDLLSDVYNMGIDYPLDGAITRSTVWSSGAKESGIPFPAWTALDGFGKYKSNGNSGASDGNANVGDVTIILTKMDEPGSVIVPHWHKNAEMGLIYGGTAKITVTGSSSTGSKPKKSRRRVLKGGGEQKDDYVMEEQEIITESFLVEAGEGYYIPPGYQHLFQQVSEEQVDLIIFFNTEVGNAIRMNDIIHMMPTDIMAKTLEVTETQIESWYGEDDADYFHPHDDWTVNESLEGKVHHHSQFKIPKFDTDLTVAPRSELHGITATKSITGATVDTFNVGGTLSMAYTEIAPGARMEPYWIENADEVVLVVEGTNVEVTRADDSKDCLDQYVIHKEYMSIHEIGMVRSIENKGESTAKIIRVFNDLYPTMNTFRDAWDNLPKDIRKSVWYPDA